MSINLLINKTLNEGVKEAMVFTNYSKYAMKLDLKSGYHHLEIHLEHQKFGNQVKYFKFAVLPFGLSSAGHIFTKTIRVLVIYWRYLGFPIVVYLDAGFATAVDYEGCENMPLQVQNRSANIRKLAKDHMVRKYQKTGQGP